MNNEMVNNLLTNYGSALDTAAERKPGDWMHKPGEGSILAAKVFTSIRDNGVNSVNLGSVLKRAMVKTGYPGNIFGLKMLEADITTAWPAGPLPGSGKLAPIVIHGNLGPVNYQP